MKRFVGIAGGARCVTWGTLQGPGVGCLNDKYFVIKLLSRGMSVSICAGLIQSVSRAFAKIGLRATTSPGKRVSGDPGGGRGGGGETSRISRDNE